MKFNSILHIFFLVGTIAIHGHAFGSNTETEEHLAQAKSLIYGSPDSAENILNTIVADASAIGDDAALMRAYRLLGILKDVRGEYDNALKWYDQAAALAHQLADTAMMGRVLMVKGILAHRQFEYEKALSLYLKARTLTKRSGTKAQLAAVLNNIAVVYRELSLLEEAQSIYVEVIELAEEVGDSLRLAPAYLNLAALILEFGDVDSAEHLALSSLEIHKKANNDFYFASCYQTLASIYSARTDYDTALVLIKKAIKGHKKYHKIERLPSAYCIKAKLHLKRSELDSALISADSAVILSEQASDHSGAAKAYLILADILTAKGDVEGSIKYYKTVIRMLDSVNSYKVQSKMLAFQVDQQTDSYKRDLQLTQQKQTEMEAHEKVNKLFILSLIMTLIFTVVILVVLFRANAHRNKFLDHVSLQNKQYKELIMVQGNTLSVVGHDLRAPIASLLGLFRLIKEQQLDPEEIKEVISRGETSLEYTLLNIDGLIEWAGKKEVLDTSTKSMVKAKAAAEQVLELYKLMARAKEIAVYIEGDATAEACVYEGDLELIIRNLLNNALKFSPRGTETWIRISTTENGLHLEVEDTGAGMTDTELDSIREQAARTTAGTEGEIGSGMGVALLFETIARNNGTIDYSSEKGIGTKVSIVLPNC